MHALLRAVLNNIVRPTAVESHGICPQFSTNVLPVTTCIGEQVIVSFCKLTLPLLVRLLYIGCIGGELRAIAVGFETSFQTCPHLDNPSRGAWLTTSSLSQPGSAWCINTAANGRAEGSIINTDAP